MKKITLMALAVPIMMSCEKETYYDYIIENRSGTEIIVDGRNIVYAQDIDQTIPSDGDASIATWKKRGKTNELMAPESMFGTDLVITNTNGDTLTKNLQLMDNWDVNLSDKRATSNHKYLFLVEDSDF